MSGKKREMQVFEVVRKTALSRLLKECGVKKAEVKGNEGSADCCRKGKRG